MQTDFFRMAWNDIRLSQNWFGKILLLALISCIPVFGWIVVFGYLFGWARDIAWDVKAPLPAHVFGNEDGELYSRGFYALVIAVVLSLIAGVIVAVFLLIEIVPSIIISGGSYFGSLASVLAMVFGVLLMISMAGVCLFGFFFWAVGSLRMSIYGRLSAGLQFARVWSMIRHDFKGLLLVLVKLLLLVLGFYVAVVLIVLAVMLPAVLTGGLVVGGVSLAGWQDLGSTMGAMTFAHNGFLILLQPIVVFAGKTMVVLFVMLTARAIGYWTRQFDVSAWRGQDDPLPFETRVQ